MAIVILITIIFSLPPIAARIARFFVLEDLTDKSIGKGFPNVVFSLLFAMVVISTWLLELKGYLADSTVYIATAFISGVLYFAAIIIFSISWSGKGRKEETTRIVYTIISIAFLIIPVAINIGVYGFIEYKDNKKLKEELSIKNQINDSYIKECQEAMASAPEIALALQEYTYKEINKVYYYNDTGNLIREEKYGYACDWLTDDEVNNGIEFTDEQSIQIKYCRHIASAYVSESTIYNYDTEGKLESVVWNSYEGEKPSLILESYSYDADGRLIKSKKCTGTSNLNRCENYDELSYETHYYTYDENGYLLKDLCKIDDIDQYCEEYKYSNGRLVKFMYYEKLEDNGGIETDQIPLNESISIGYSGDYISSVHIERFNRNWYDNLSLDVTYNKYGMSTYHEKYYIDSICYETKMQTKRDSNGDYLEDDYYEYENGKLTRHIVTDEGGVWDEEGDFEEFGYYIEREFIDKIENDVSSIQVEIPSVEKTIPEYSETYAFKDEKGNVSYIIEVIPSGFDTMLSDAKAWKCPECGNQNYAGYICYICLHSR